MAKKPNKKESDWIDEAIDKWNLEDVDEYEFLNWSELPRILRVGDFMGDNIEAKYTWIKPNYKSLNPDWVNLYNKKQPRMEVDQLIESNGDVYNYGTFYLAMGKRLYKQIKTALLSKWRYIEIVRVITDENSYTTQYYVREKKPIKQVTLKDFSF